MLSLSDAGYYTCIMTSEWCDNTTASQEIILQGYNMGLLLQYNY